MTRRVLCWHWFFACLTVVALGWIVIEPGVPSGHAWFYPDKHEKRVGDFWPLDYLAPAPSENQRIILQTPVSIYFEPGRKFKDLVIRFEMKRDSHELVHLSLPTGYKIFTETKLSVTTTTPDGWEHVEQHISLDPLFVPKERRYYFLLTSPTLSDSGRRIIIRNLSMEASGKSWNPWQLSKILEVFSLKASPIP